MKTPYDTALRIAARQLDDVRAAIGRANEDLRRIDAAHGAIDAAMRREGALAAGDPRHGADRYLRHARLLRERLRAERAGAMARLEALRAEAVEHYGSHTAVESAATGYRSAAEHAIAAAEQTASDDLAGTRHRVASRPGSPR